MNPGALRLFKPVVRAVVALVTDAGLAEHPKVVALRCAWQGFQQSLGITRPLATVPDRERREETEPVLFNGERWHPGEGK